jgi:hypothetical protein
MTSLLYISHPAKLTDDEKRYIDTSVLENRVAVRKFVKKVYVKRKGIFIGTVFWIFILVSTPKDAKGIGMLSTPSAPIIMHSTKVVPS